MTEELVRNVESDCTKKQNSLYDDVDNSDIIHYNNILLRDKKYKMNHGNRGKAIIFNHRYFANHYSPRIGTDVDVQNLKKTLPKMGFREEDIHIFNDLRASEIDEKLREVKRENHDDNDLLMVFVLTHGRNGDKISAYDEEYPVENIWMHFTADKCHSLIGKPKIFVIVACRGDDVDRGSKTLYMSENQPETEVDASPIESYIHYSIPIWSDFLYVFSTVKGYYSYRNVTEGTWYINAFCDQISCEDFDQISFLETLTAVNGRLAKLYQAGNLMDKRKQTPIINSTLTKHLYFKQKY